MLVEELLLSREQTRVVVGLKCDAGGRARQWQPFKLRFYQLPHMFGIRTRAKQANLPGNGESVLANDAAA